MRVLVVSSKYPPEYSGSGNRAHATYLRLKKDHGIDFDVLCGSVTENTNRSYTQDGVRVQRIAGKWLPVRRFELRERALRDKIGLRLNYFPEARAAAGFFNRHHAEYDAVHVFGSNAVTAAVISRCNRLRKPLVVEFCNEVDSPYPYRPWVVKLFDREEFHARARLVCISKRLENMCRRNGVANMIWTRPNPVDTKRFFVERAKRNHYRSMHTRFKPEDIVLVNVSNFIPRKNQAFLVETLKFLPEEYKLFLAGPVVGSGPNRKEDRSCVEQVEKKIAELDLEARVQLKTGYVDRIDEAMKAGDVYVFPTRAEGLGTPMLESLCCGVPVVATRIEGITDQWIIDGENGYLSKLDPREFADRIMSSASISRDQLDSCAREVSDRVSTRTVDEGYVRLLKEIIKESG